MELRFLIDFMSNLYENAILNCFDWRFWGRGSVGLNLPEEED